MSVTRSASHAGSWYKADPRVLGVQLDMWMDDAEADMNKVEHHHEQHEKTRAVIVPHAGYSYSGRTAGYSYAKLRAIAPSIKRAYILGPSHHVYSTDCMLTLADQLETPLGNLRVDRSEVQRLSKLEGFSKWSSISEDEDEHSVEMQLPYVYRVFGANPGFTVVPITVGSLSLTQEARAGKVLAECLNSSENVLIISSDFCHWGSRFRYQFRIDSKLPIYESIQTLDLQGVNIIESKDHQAFSDYIKSYKNTICGRHPIGVLLGTIASIPESSRYSIRFLHYEQSSRCMSMDDSSVSYVAMAITTTTERDVGE